MNVFAYQPLPKSTNTTHQRLDEIIEWIKTFDDRTFDGNDINIKFRAKYSDNLNWLIDYLRTDDIIGSYREKKIIHSATNVESTYSYTLTPKGEHHKYVQKITFGRWLKSDTGWGNLWKLLNLLFGALFGVITSPFWKQLWHHFIK